MEELCERPHKLIHKELRCQYLDTLTYKDIRNISRNMQKARSSQLLPLPTDIEESHETLSAVQVLKVRQNLLVNDLDKTIVIDSRKNNLKFLAPLMGFTLTGHSNQHRSFFFHQLFTNHRLAICNLHFSYRSINIQRSMRMYQTYGLRGWKTGCECFPNNCFC